MLLADNTNATTGDLLDMDGGMYGIVVVDFDKKTAIDDSFLQTWNHIQRGMLVYCKDMGMIHYLSADPDIRLLSTTIASSRD